MSCPAQEDNRPPEAIFFDDPEIWQTIILNIIPFSIDTSILMKSEKGAMEKFAHIYMEFPDTSHIFQQATFLYPFKIKYRSFSHNDSVAIRDLSTDSFGVIPSRLSPVSIFSLEESATSFFKKVKVLDMEPLDFDDQQTLVFRIKIDPMEMNPGMVLKDIEGNLWFEPENSRPLKLIVVGSAEFLNEGARAMSILVDFHYSDFIVKKSHWNSIDEGIDEFELGKEDIAEKIFRETEKEIGNPDSFKDAGKNRIP